MTTARHNACIIIPCYNHGATMPALLGQLAPLALPVIIVNDGSDAPTTQTLRHLATTPPHPLDITLLEHPANQGKGAATTTALREARRHGITHALQIDADGQHDTSALPALLATSREHPEALVSGHPRYDATISLTRKLARHITHAWVRLETLSCQIKDSMCGLRVYPVTPTLALLEKPRPRIGRRMDFDIEIMVRHYWAGHPVHFVPVRVTYPPDGISHFRPLRDNLRITWMHTRLFLGMLPRAPRLLARHLSKKKPNRPLPPPTHWANIPEKRGLRGMRLLFHVDRIFGYKPFARRLLHPVIFPYWLTSPRQRRTSRDWLRRIRDHATAPHRAGAAPPPPPPPAPPRRRRGGPPGAHTRP
ncbi:MAG: glycosyltransferase family 2 protein, partial [Opitutaceae bacterium]|nr:glycosyltransferase family 2 protein [Opitutaceae bacterium]